MRPSSSRNSGGVGVMVTVTEEYGVHAGFRPLTVLESEATRETERGKGSARRGGRHKVRLTDSELQVINATASCSPLTDGPPSLAAVCVWEREGNTCSGRT